MQWNFIVSRKLIVNFNDIKIKLFFAEILWFEKLKKNLSMIKFLCNFIVLRAVECHYQKEIIKWNSTNNQIKDDEMWWTLILNRLIELNHTNTLQFMFGFRAYQPQHSKFEVYWIPLFQSAIVSKRHCFEAPSNFNHNNVKSIFDSIKNIRF